jgi:hypothetical protein
MCRGEKHPLQWCSPHPAEARRLFEVYGELTGRETGWLERLPLLHLRQHMALMAMYDHDWGSSEAVRAGTRWAP